MLSIQRQIEELQQNLKQKSMPRGSSSVKVEEQASDEEEEQND